MKITPLELLLNEDTPKERIAWALRSRAEDFQSAGLYEIASQLNQLAGEYERKEFRRRSPPKRTYSL